MNASDRRHPDELISALFDGELAPEEWVEVKEHLEGCARCRRLLEQIKSLSSAMPADPPVPEGRATRVKERLPAGTGRQRPAPPSREPIPYRATRRRITFLLAAGAGLAATLIVGALLIQYMPASVTSRLRLPTLSAEEPADSTCPSPRSSPGTVLRHNRVRAQLVARAARNGSRTRRPNVRLRLSVTRMRSS